MAIVSEISNARNGRQNRVQTFNSGKSPDHEANIAKGKTNIQENLKHLLSRF
ncbi:uncharacterized protein LOC101246131 [Anopheles sinensis]|uniref:Uncharacterized protein LOC101246131 n=1 Tax=Anopheles sinensis TaxID=74873 RepID=A0A084WDT8_ANOSI|nr:uncharacterized protein LOC101246131 [Anopheles sinensis]